MQVKNPKPGSKRRDVGLQLALIDDDPLLLEAMAHALAGQPGFLPPQTFSSTAEAVKGLRHWPVDVALVDLNLGAESGIDCIAKLLERRLATSVIALTVSDDPESVNRAFAAGAHGYLVKTAHVEDLVTALQQFRSGKPAMSPIAVRHIVRSFRRDEPAAGNRLGLSPAEWRILGETAAGHNCKAIARRFQISLSTVYVHNRRILKKLNVHSRLAAVAMYRNLAGTPPAGGS